MKKASVKLDLVAVHVYPKSPWDRVEGLVKDSAGVEWLKVRVTAQATDGKANKAVLKLLAKEWGCSVSHLEIAKGETSRYKWIRRRD
jgi:uncharacterized protein (TIGR00251 family)